MGVATDFWVKIYDKGINYFIYLLFGVAAPYPKGIFCCWIYKVDFS